MRSAPAAIGKVTTATMLVRAGPLSVGLDVADGKVGVDLIHGQETLTRALSLEGATVR